MARDEITGEPEPIYCAFCRKYIPHGQAANILGQDACPECKKQFVIALVKVMASKMPMTIDDYRDDYRLETKGPDLTSGPEK